MNIENVIKLFLDDKINVNKVIDMFENGELTLDSINDKFEYGRLMQDLNKKYKEVVGGVISFPYDYTWKESMIALMIAIEKKVNIDEVTEGTRSELSDDMLI